MRSRTPLTEAGHGRRTKINVDNPGHYKGEVKLGDRVSGAGIDITLTVSSVIYIRRTSSTFRIRSSLNEHVESKLISHHPLPPRVYTKALQVRVRIFGQHFWDPILERVSTQMRIFYSCGTQQAGTGDSKLYGGESKLPNSLLLALSLFPASLTAPVPG